MTEEQIERWYEREQDALDADLMNAVISQKEYDKACKELAAEVNEMYHELRYPHRRH
jgi:hypothetical protein